MFNRGVALVPETLVAKHDGRTLESQGSLLFAWHAGKVLELRWFADEVEREDAFFGPPDPAASGPTEASAPSKRQRRRRARLKKPGQRQLLALYSLFKQASAGDVSGDRPGVMDMVGRAKYDAWAKRKGLSRDDAMRQYVELVETLKKGETETA